MVQKSAHFIILGLAVALVGCGSKPTPPSVAAVQNGGIASRREVKIGLDPNAATVNMTPQDTTIEAIQGQPVPSKLGGRVGPFETSTWKVKATLESIKLMKDGDYYMVLQGDKGGKTVVEVPDPSKCKGSPWLSQISQARTELENKYHPTTTEKKLDDNATVTGVGFLGWGPPSKDPKKGASGYSGARLLPGLGFDFGEGKDKKS